MNSTQTAIVAGTATFGQCWGLDSTGNWRNFREDDTGSGTWNRVQSRSANTVNEITAISNTVGSAWVNPVHDSNGNMTTIPQPADPTKSYTGTFDAWNRLAKLVDPTTGHIVQANAYDGRKFRTIRNDYANGVLTETRHFFYTSGWQTIEERIGSSANPNRQFVWGQRFLDDLVLRDRDPTGGGTLNERLFALQDTLGSVAGATDSSGAIQERYAYSPYGAPIFLSSAFAVQSGSLFDWETLFASYRYDSMTGLLDARNRSLRTDEVISVGIIGVLHGNSIWGLDRQIIWSYWL